MKLFTQEKLALVHLRLYNIVVAVSGIGRPPAQLIVENGDGAMNVVRSLCRFETYQPHHVIRISILTFIKETKCQIQ